MPIPFESGEKIKDFLEKPFDNDYDKAKAIAFWIASHIYYDEYLYNNGGASRSKLAESHKRFVQDIEHKNEEKLSRTQELNTAKVQALKELGYTEINEKNATEVFERIAEIQSRKI